MKTAKPATEVIRTWVPARQGISLNIVVTAKDATLYAAQKKEGTK